MPSTTSTTALEDILGWSEKLPLWQRDALRRIVCNGELTSEDYAELVALCRKQHGLPAKGVAIPEPKPFAAADMPGSFGGASHSVALLGISHVENVNALCGQQDLAFGERGITIVFGYNGSGKSGYGRILKKACRARRKGNSIMPNVLRGPSTGPASAEIRYSWDGDEQAPEQWIDGVRDIPALSGVSFFDAECASAHVADKNTIAFVPFGLDVLPKLGKALLQVQSALEQEKKQENASQPEFLRTHKTRPETAVGKLIRGLKVDTDPVEVEKLAGLHDDDIKRMEGLRSELAHDPQKAADALRTRARRIATLHEIVSQASMSLGDEGLDRLKALASDHLTKKQAASVAAEKLFIDEPISDVGGTVWRQLWEAARSYSTTVAYPNEPFPPTAEKGTCVLCQQPLAPDAANRMRRFEAFVRDDTASKAVAAKSALDAAILATDRLRMHETIVPELIEELATDHAAACAAVKQLLAALQLRHKWVATAASNGDWEAGRPAFVHPGTPLKDLATGLEKRADELSASANPAQRAELQAKLAELEDRQWLGTVVGDVKIELDRRKRIAMIDQCLADTKTTGITAKSKALAKEHVTDQLRLAFAEEVKAMQQGVSRLEIELASTSGEHGSSQYRVQLVGASQTSVDRVVSEGEHRCIALAGFLAELATQQAKSCIIFDDPVTSLDHRWRHCLASRLVREGAVRQVIVFTHDIVFLHDLMDGARHANATLTVQRVAADRDRTGLINDCLPWEAQSCKQQIDTLEKQARATRPLFNNGDDDQYFREARLLYTDLRSAIECVVERELFAGVVHRFRDYVDLKRLKEASLFSSADCDRIQKLFAKCCDITAAHSRALPRSLGAPSPDEMLADIKELSDIILEVKERHKNSSKPSASLAS